jgi:Uma2 family endonuclease
MSLPDYIIASDNIVEDVSRSRHGRTLFKLCAVLIRHLEEKTPPLGRVYPETDLYFSITSPKYIPDISVTLAGNDILNRERDVLIGVPDLIVEVLSASSFMSDTDTKFQVYQAEGVKEYWIISAEQRLITVYQLVNGQYQTASIASITGVIHSPLLPELEVRLEEVFDPVP